MILAAAAAIAFAQPVSAQLAHVLSLTLYIDDDETADDLDSKADDLEDEAHRLRGLHTPGSFDLDMKATNMEDQAQKMRDEAERLRDLN
jgi:hypothetical protein